eukprot:1140710-Pelagomonas_calceolata.AAC.10
MVAPPFLSLAAAFAAVETTAFLCGLREWQECWRRAPCRGLQSLELLKLKPMQAPLVGHSIGCVGSTTQYR